jgi:CBS domain-containing protein
MACAILHAYSPATLIWIKSATRPLAKIQHHRCQPEETVMTTVAEICNREVVVVERNASILNAARLMRDYHVGDLVVVEERDGQRIPVGIVTDRDIVIEVIAEEVAFDEVTVEDIMSLEIVTAREGDDLLDTLKRMRTHGIRRVPVVNGSQALIGILTVDDVIEVLAEELNDLARLIGREQTRERDQRR